MSNEEYAVGSRDNVGEDSATVSNERRSVNIANVLSYLIPAYVFAVSISYIGVYPFAKFSHVNPLIASMMLSAFIVFVICIAVHSYLSSETTRIASAITAGVMAVTYFIYVWSIASSRGLSVIPVPLFDLLCGSSHCSVSLDLGQLGIIAMAYLLRDKFVSVLRRVREP